MARMQYRLFALVAGALLASSCATPPPARIASCLRPPASSPTIVRDGEIASTTIDVLTFNIAGLPWPARANRKPDLQRIGEIMARLNSQGAAPDVVLIQEMFSATAMNAVGSMNYPYRVWGPRRTQQPTGAEGRIDPPYRRLKGEFGFHLVGSGLAILSRYPVVASDGEPFGTHRCAGIDCLSNKGVQRAEVVIPGVPQRLELFNAHLNAQKASRVPQERTLAAHALQVNDIARLIGSTSGAKMPAILGGDFNMGSAPDRLDYFESEITRFALVHRYCREAASSCDVRLSWDGDEPWLDTHDLQLFRDGAAVTVTPLRAEAMFDGSEGQPRLSDHDGFRVRYRLSWRAGQTPAIAIPACG